MLNRISISSFFSSLKNKMREMRTNQTLLFCAFLSVLYLISGYCRWLEILVSVGALVFMAIMPLQSALCVFMFLHCFTLSRIGFDSCFIVTVIGFTLILLVKYCIGVKKGEYKFHKKLVICLVIFILFSTAISFFHKLYRGSGIYFTYAPLFYFLYAMRKEFDIRQGMNYMLSGLIICIISSLLAMILPMYQYVPFYEGRYRGFMNHPNYLYIRALFVLSYYMYCYLNKNLSHFGFLFIYLFCSLVTLATTSKTGLGMLLLFTLIFVVLYLKQDFKKHIKIVGIFACILMWVCLIGYPFISKIISRFSKAFNGSNVIRSLLTGRDEIWKCYIVETFEHPLKFLFGHGLVATEAYIPSQATTRASHNLYLFLLYRFGLFGCIFLGYVIYKFFKMTIINKPKFIASLPLLFMLVESLFDNTFKGYHFACFAFAIMILFLDCKSKIETDCKGSENQNTEITPENK